MGHRVTRAVSHFSVDEVKERMQTESRPWVRHHWWIIYHALVAPCNAEEIALHPGVTATTVHRVISAFSRQGPAAMETPGKEGRWHEYLALSEELVFLAPFFTQAENGQIATTAQIQHAFEEHVGHQVDDSMIYRLLHRHGWRKVMPRPRHPQADLQTHEQFKKTFQRTWEQQLPREKLGMSVLS